MGDLILRRENTATRQSQTHTATRNKDEDLIITKLHAIAEAVADRAEMHAIIGAQRNNWNHFFLHSINSINLTASLMVGISSIPLGEANPHLLAFKLSSMVLFAAATGMMLVVNKIQPSQLAEEQRNATRLWKQLERSIHATLALRAPTELDVEEAITTEKKRFSDLTLPTLGGSVGNFKTMRAFADAIKMHRFAKIQLPNIYPTVPSSVHPDPVP